VKKKKISRMGHDTKGHGHYGGPPMARWPCAIVGLCPSDLCNPQSRCAKMSPNQRKETWGGECRKKWFLQKCLLRTYRPRAGHLPVLQ